MSWPLAVSATAPPPFVNGSGLIVAEQAAAAVGHDVLGGVPCGEMDAFKFVCRLASVGFVLLLSGVLHSVSAAPGCAGTS
jgi:hypothetical protein